MSIADMTLIQLSAALQSGELSVEEAVRACAERIAELDEGIGAFISVDAEAALNCARSMDGIGKRLSPLAGVPVALKDNICVQGGRTTCASRMLEGFVSPYSATVWERLRAAGCILLGKTNLDEFGMGSTTGHSAFRTTRNPHDLAHTPGGSSGGSAAAVAAGMVPLALGSDTGGSVRQPASHCGVVGMKPTYGTVSRYGLVAFASSLEQIGPITRTVADNALALSMIAGHDHRDGTSVQHPGGFSDRIGHDVRGLRIGLPRQMLSGDLCPEVRHAVMDAARSLEGLGATVEEVSLPCVEYALPAYYILSSAEASSNLARFDGVRYGRRAADCASLEELYVRSRSEGFGDEVKRRILLGTYVLSEGHWDSFYKRAMQARTLVMREFDGAFARVDCLLTPVAPTTAPLLEQHPDPVSAYLEDAYTVPANIAGIPALSLPWRKDGQGLPIGVQLMGPAFSEPLLYQVGQALECAARPKGKEGNC